ncbi:glycerol kinase GlpK [Rubellicoccus peritrichatus]|uniref:Glycerol kinase n=1 Tax=Rubellicoccus peritrichatus TaxID=3080537 RepID=A0AAQ3LD02_9BACT|nr:glycerol kinase GlpK [Puniceicoccus sp. CR14]WOO42202.1 glycerol kinase GlpK [Puniceicoccus sp. CR14]
MPHILALDQGTTSSRAIVFNEAGSIVAMAQQEFPQHFPKSGWVEHDANDIWNSQETVAREALKKANLTATDIAAIGITNQRETTLLWDRKTGEPIGNAIVWQDRRTSSYCDDLERSGGDILIRRKTGLLIDPYFSGTKVNWMLEHYDGARKRAEAGELAFGTVDTWLVWKLTGGAVHATDPTNACRTLLYNIHEEQWDDELLQLLDVPHEVLPEVKPSSGVFGECAADSIAPGVPIAGIGGDQQAALFGQTCYTPGMAKNTYGTGCFLLMNLGEEPRPSKHNLLTTIGWKLGEAPTHYALEGSVFIGGAAVQWLRDGLGIIKSAPEVEPLAASVPDSGGAYMVSAFAGLGAPHWDPEARGMIIGIERGTTAAHLARAALDGVAFRVADLLTAMNEDAGVPLKELRVDGGASANNLLMQIQADLLQVPVVRPECVETTALGAAYLAGLATGVWRNTEELAAHWKIDRTFEPQISADEAAERHRQWSRAIERAKKWQEL